MRPEDEGRFQDQEGRRLALRYGVMSKVKMVAPPPARRYRRRRGRTGRQVAQPISSDRLRSSELACSAVDLLNGGASLARPHVLVGLRKLRRVHRGKSLSATFCGGGDRLVQAGELGPSPLLNEIITLPRAGILKGRELSARIGRVGETLNANIRRELSACVPDGLVGHLPGCPAGYPAAPRETDDQCDDDRAHAAPE
ncbi:hypothetical protein V1279_006492 [Bradyrhizobium sp. AZCC 1610]